MEPIEGMGLDAIDLNVKPFQSALCPFMTNIGILALDVLEVARESQMFHMQNIALAYQAAHLVSLLDKAIDPNHGPTSDQFEEQTNLETDLLSLEETIRIHGTTPPKLEKTYIACEEVLAEQFKKLWRTRSYFQVGELDLELKMKTLREHDRLPRPAAQSSAVIHSFLTTTSPGTPSVPVLDPQSPLNREISTTFIKEHLASSSLTHWVRSLNEIIQETQRELYHDTVVDENKSVSFAVEPLSTRRVPQDRTEGSGSAIGNEPIAGPSKFLELSEDVLLAVFSHLSCVSLTNLSSTCKRLHLLVGSKSVWLDVLEDTLQRRPVPLSYRNLVSRWTTAELPLKDVKEAVIRAVKLEHSWSQPVIKPTRYEYYPLTAECDEQDSFMWAWNLDVGRYLMTYSAQQWFTCYIRATKQNIRFNTVKASCWDFDLDTEGITIVFNSVDDHPDVPQCMEVYRINLGDSPSWRKCTSVLVTGEVRSNILEEEIAGCLVSPENSTVFLLHIVDWKTGKHAIINTEISNTINLSASTTKAHMLFCYETTDTLDCWFYNLSFLRSCLEKAEPEQPYHVKTPPQHHHKIQYVAQGIKARPSIRGAIYPTTRGMWTGRQCIFSHMPEWNEQFRESLHYAVLPDPKQQTQFIPSAESTPTMRESSSVSRRTFLYTPQQPSRLFSRAGWYALSAIGFSGKHAIWAEETGDGKILCRLTTFDHEDDAEVGLTTNSFSTIDWEHDEFNWQEVSGMTLDDNAGIIAFVTSRGIYNLYFD